MVIFDRKEGRKGMTEADLIPITSKERAIELGSKGGKVKSDGKKYAALIARSRVAKCKNCRAVCVLKKGHIEMNKNFICNLPDARAKSIWFNMPVMSEEILDKIDAESLLRLVKESKNTKDFKMILDAVATKKKGDYPKAQKVDIDQKGVVINIEGVDLDKYFQTSE